MNTFVVLPDQLFNDISVLEFLGDFDKIIIAEDPAYFKSASEGKIALIRAAMKSYYSYLEEQLPIVCNREDIGAKKAKSAVNNSVKNTVKNAVKNSVNNSVKNLVKKEPPKIIYIEATKILPRGDIFEYLTGTRTQIHMFRIAACYTWGSKPWDSTYYGLPIKFHESPGFLVPYCEIKYGDIFIAGSTRITKTGGMEVNGVSFGEFVHRFFKIAIDNCDTKDSTRYDPAATKVVMALPQSFASANLAISGFKKSHNAINAAEFSYEPTFGIEFVGRQKNAKTPKSNNLRLSAKKYAKEVFAAINKINKINKINTGDAINKMNTSTIDKSEKTQPRKIGSNPEIITRVNSHDLKASISQQKSAIQHNVKLNRAQSVMVGIDKMAKNSEGYNFHSDKVNSDKVNTDKVNEFKFNTDKVNEFKVNYDKVKKPKSATSLLKDLDEKNYPVTITEVNKLSIAFMNKFVRDYATYPSGAILELMFPLNMGLITPQMLLTHVISVLGPQNKQNILLFLRDLLYREYLRCVYITDAQFIDETYNDIGLTPSIKLEENLEKTSIYELTKLKKNIMKPQKFMGFACAKIPWYFYWCGFLQI